MRQNFILHSKIITYRRRFLEELGSLETTIRDERHPAGAVARPPSTYHHELGLNVHDNCSRMLPLKDPGGWWHHLGLGNQTPVLGWRNWSDSEFWVHHLWVLHGLRRLPWPHGIHGDDFRDGAAHDRQSSQGPGRLSLGGWLRPPFCRVSMTEDLEKALWEKLPETNSLKPKK